MCVLRTTAAKYQCRWQCHQEGLHGEGGHAYEGLERGAGLCQVQKDPRDKERTSRQWDEHVRR